MTAFTYPLMVSFGMPCLFRTITGLYCPGCGGTRAAIALLHGNIILSFFYHPLVLYIAVVAVFYIASHALSFVTKKPGFRKDPGSAFVNAALVIIVINFLVKNYFLIFRGIDILEMLPTP